MFKKRVGAGARLCALSFVIMAACGGDGDGRRDPAGIPPVSRDAGSDVREAGAERPDLGAAEGPAADAVLPADAEPGRADGPSGTDLAPPPADTRPPADAPPTPADAAVPPDGPTIPPPRDAGFEFPAGLLPEPPRLTAASGDALVDLSWTTSARATSYELYRSTISGGPYTMVATTGHETSFRDTAVSNQVTYYYIVRARSANGPSPPSNEAIARPEAALSLLIRETTTTLNGVVHARNAFYAASDQGTIFVWDGARWSFRPSGLRARLNAIAAGGGMIVAVGAGGAVSSSADGVAWLPRAADTSQEMLAVAHGGDRFVAVGRGTTSLASADGVGWTARPMSLVGTPGGRTLTAAVGLAYAAQTWVAVGDLGGVPAALWSTDASRWTVVTFPNVAFQPRALAFGGGRFMALGAAGDGYLSADGRTWTPMPQAAPLRGAGLAHDGNRFIAVGAGGRVALSIDGSAWTAVPHETYRDLRAVAAGRMALLAVGAFTTAIGSSDGAAWTHLRGSEVTLRALAHEAVGETLLGIGLRGEVLARDKMSGAWTGEAGTAARGMHAAAAARDRWVAVGAEGRVMTSTDGITWTATPSATTRHLRDVIWSGSQFVAVGDGGTVVTSLDGLSWTKRDVPTTATLWALASTLETSGARVVAVGGDGAGAIVRSADGGSTWTAVAAGAPPLNDVAQLSGRFVAVGRNRAVLVSPDGLSWSDRVGPPDVESNLLVVEATEAGMVACDEAGTCGLSKDQGDTWVWQVGIVNGRPIRAIAVQKQAAIALPGAVLLTSMDAGAQTLSFARVDFPAEDRTLARVASGAGRTVTTGPVPFVSADAAAWQARWPTRWPQQFLVHHETLFVGFLGATLLSSLDGLSWSVGGNGPGDVTGFGRIGPYYYSVSGNGMVATAQVLAAPSMLRLTGTGRLVGAATGNGLAVGLVADGRAVVSRDGETWTQIETGATRELTGIYFDGSRFLALGAGGTILASADAVTWTPVPTPTTATLRAAVTSGGSWLVVGDAGTVLSSRDGTTWLLRVRPTAVDLTSVAHTGSRFVATGAEGTILSGP